MESKLKEYDGLPGVISAEAEILESSISQKLDFIFIGCDGIFDVLSDGEVLEVIKEAKREYLKSE